MELVVFEPGRLLEVAIALRLGDRLAQLAVIGQQLAPFAQLGPLRLPALLQVLQGFDRQLALLLQLQAFRHRGCLGRQ